MANRNTPRGFMPRSLMEYRVAGLRDYEKPTEVRVFSADTGEFLRTEKPIDFYDFDQFRATKWRRK